LDNEVFLFLDNITTILSVTLSRSISNLYEGHFRLHYIVLFLTKQYGLTCLFVCCAGQIGYALVPMIARGIMLGADQPVILHMLDIPPAAEALNGVKMELVDAAFPLLKGKLIQFNNLLKRCLLLYVDYHPYT
jgi:hypothetical protein